MFQDIDIGPEDPRFIGAWWLGLVILGFISMFIAVPMMCFPRTLKPRRNVQENDYKLEQKSATFVKELKGKQCTVRLTDIFALNPTNIAV